MIDNVLYNGVAIIAYLFLQLLCPRSRKIFDKSFRWVVTHYKFGEIFGTVNAEACRIDTAINRFPNTRIFALNENQLDDSPYSTETNNPTS